MEEKDIEYCDCGNKIKDENLEVCEECR